MAIVIINIFCICNYYAPQVVTFRNPNIYMGDWMSMFTAIVYRYFNILYNSKIKHFKIILLVAIQFFNSYNIYDTNNMI